MPSPVAHGLVTLAYISAWPPYQGYIPWRQWKTLIWIGVLAVLPDLDFIPGLITGRHLEYHHLWTHTLFAGIVAGSLTACLWWAVGKRAFRQKLLMCIGAYWLHLALDMATRDDSPVNGIGMQLFWPVSDRWFEAPIVLFRTIMHTHNHLSLERTLSGENIVPFSIEAGVGLAAASVILALARRYSR